MSISVVTINSLVQLEMGKELPLFRSYVRWNWASRKDDLCLFLSLQSTPSYVDWNWASRKDDLCLILSLQSTSSYVDWNWAS